jgi:uncharacterized protein (TIGR02145 family)
MKKYLGFVAVSVFLLSCADDTRDNPQDERAVNYLSSPSVPSSSSLDGGYSGSYGSVTHGGQTYKTVKIGEQTWMAENLNYNPGTGNSVCYDNQANNCTTYGRLYDWPTAKTACPAGWHLPDNAEWDALVTYSGFPGTAGTKLKAKSGWNDNDDFNGASGNGTDQCGFSALPGGAGSFSGSFYGVGYYGSWWSASEDDAYYCWDMGYVYSSVGWGSQDKSGLCSVRCVQD